MLHGVGFSALLHPERPLAKEKMTGGTPGEALGYFPG
jgi:hypothetical protein